MKYRVTIPLPQKTEYLLDADYPEKAKREAAQLHRKLMPGVSIAEIALMASCYKVHPDSNGGRHKSSTFIESAYRTYFLAK
jgi:hypothetical protein